MPIAKGIQATRWYTEDLPAGNAQNNNTVTGISAFDTLLVPVTFFVAGTIQAMGVYKTNTSNRTGLKARMAVYNQSTDGKPGTVLTDFGEVDLATASVGIISVNGTAVVAPGTYFLACKIESLGTAGTHPTLIKRGLSAYDTGWCPWGFSGTYSTDFNNTAFNPIGHVAKFTLASGAFGDLSSTDPVTATTSVMWLPWYKFTPDAEGGAGWAWHGANPYWQVMA